MSNIVMEKTRETAEQVTVKVNQLESNEQKANNLLNNILKLKGLKKEAKKALDEELEGNSNYTEAKIKYNEAKLALKEAKEATLNLDNAKKLQREIDELQEEIKNDSDILNEFVSHAYREGEQMRLFAFEKEYMALPNFKIEKKK